jgi:hypothetical protein
MTLKIHVPMFYKRDTRAKLRGKELIGLSLKRAGSPVVQQDNRPHPMTDFNKRKIKESEATARAAERGALKDQSATNSDKVTKHFKPARS